MKNTTMSRWRASIAGLTFSIAALAGAIVPAIDAAAATAVTNLTAVWNSTNRTVELAWSGTGVGSDTYTVMYNQTAGSGPALDDQGLPLQNLTLTTAVSKNDSAYASGQTLRFSIFTISTDSSFAESSEVTVVVPANTGSSPHASEPLNLSTGIYGDVASVTWEPPLESGTTPISGWQISVSNADGSDLRSMAPVTDPSARSTALTYPFMNGLSYLVLVAAINGVDGVSPNSATINFVFTGASQNGAGTPTAPNTGFTLGLSNPILVISIGAAAAAALLVIRRKLVRH